MTMSAIGLFSSFYNFRNFKVVFEIYRSKTLGSINLDTTAITECQSFVAIRTNRT